MWFLRENHKNDNQDEFLDFNDANWGVFEAGDGAIEQFESKIFEKLFNKLQRCLNYLKLKKNKLYLSKVKILRSTFKRP